LEKVLEELLILVRQLLQCFDTVGWVI